MHPDQRPPATAALTVLAHGEIEVEGRLPWSSNGTFLVTVRHEGCELRAVYKPHRGERDLWDFPDGLYLREVAAYEVSEALGWGIVPETILRDDAPLGVGSLQRFVDADFAQHYFTLLDEAAHHAELKRIGVLDLVINNADRKSGHCLIAEGRIWGIDNGLCFHVQPKLRTVIWDFGGEPIPEELRGDLARLATSPPASLAHLISEREIEALAKRAALVARLQCFPDPDPDARPYPWPLV
ncbi:MAG: SCO1664 family protein [Acidimicrobiales bacterium]